MLGLDFYCCQQKYDKVYIKVNSGLKYCSDCYEIIKSLTLFELTLNQHLLIREDNYFYLTCTFCSKELYFMQNFLECRDCTITSAIHFNEIKNGTSEIITAKFHTNDHLLGYFCCCKFNVPVIYTTELTNEKFCSYCYENYCYPERSYPLHSEHKIVYGNSLSDEKCALCDTTLYNLNYYMTCFDCEASVTLNSFKSK